MLEVCPGFTQEESLALFSRYLGVPAEHLPQEAAAIHDECRGSPMVISLVGSLLGESGRCRATQRQSGRWIHYLHSLRTRRYSKLKRSHSYQHESVLGAVGMSVENLDRADQQRYEKLAVFMDDDPVPTKTLEILWNVDRYEVEDTMNTFLQKSLAMCEVNPADPDQLLYTLHDLQLDYLKTRLRDEPEKERQLHERFVLEYLRRVNYQYGDLRSDGYIFSHLGHHLSKAGLASLFPDIFLDLGYVEANLKAGVAVELLANYRKYGVEIMGARGEREEALADFEEFCRVVGAQVGGSPGADIVQLGLREESSSAVYQAARRLADQRPDTLYLVRLHRISLQYIEISSQEWSNREDWRSSLVAALPHPTGAACLAFLPDTRLLTGTVDGGMFLWELSAGQLLGRLPGHQAEVTCISLSPGQACSGSEDGSVRLWQLPPLEEVAEAGTGTGRRRSVRRGAGRQASGVGFARLCSEPGSEVEARLPGEEEGVLAVALRPGGSEVAVGGRAGTVTVLGLGDGDPWPRLVSLPRGQGPAHTDSINWLAWSGDGTRLASASDDTTVRLWSAAGQACEAKADFFLIIIITIT